MLIPVGILTGLGIWKMKLHKSGNKTLLTLPLIGTATIGAFQRLQFTSMTFDDIDDALPNQKAEEERQAILNQCLVTDHLTAMKALREEITYCKAPTSYIYSTLI